jgi:glycine oxidase
VLVLERGTDDGASWRAAAGMLAPQIEAGKDDPLFELGIAGRQRYASLARELKENTGIEIHFWQEGIARLAVDAGDVEALQGRVAWQRERGHRADWLEREEVETHWPWMGPGHGALWAPDEAALDPVALVHALLEDARRAGARIVTEQVTGIQRQGDRITGVTGVSGKYSSDHVVIAAGAWGSGIRGLPRPLPIVPVRGQMAALPWPAGVPRGIVYGNHAYLVARGGEAIAGSTMENAGFDSRVTEEGLGTILQGAIRLCPALQGVQTRRSWAGLRPMTPDGLPILGREPEVDGLWYAAGHGRNGILLAGISGVLLAQLLNGERPHLAPAMRPDRFFNW